MRNTKLNQFVLSALFTALICIATLVIQIPSFGANGYVNIGDAFILICVFLIGGWYGALAAGLGAGLADLLSGYVIYVPGTFLIKFAMAIAAFHIYKALKKFSLPSFLSYLIPSVVAELIMIGGYFVYEAFVLGYKVAAVPAILSNSIQGGTNIILGIAVILLLEKSKAIRILKNSN